MAVSITACLVSTVAQSAIPIDKEPMHRLKFENEFVRLFDVLVPAGKTTLVHTHVYAGVGVRVSDASMIDELTSGEKRPFSATSGQSTFGSGPTFSHKVVNVGTTDFRNIYVELLADTDPEKDVPLPILSVDHVILIDNPQVRVNRLVLKPGESSKLHTHTRNGLGIIVYDAKIEITSPGTSPRLLDVKAGGFQWQAAGTTHVIKNIGSTVFEAIDVELK
jgi:mannose-6-phosphate isomerase-like protein (cupin superfamily)